MFFMLVALIFSLSCFASERILVFKSDITVHQNASMSVVETIQVEATGDTIRRGIVREFPTEYKDSWGNKFKVAFQVESVTRDGHKEPYHVESAVNGKKVYIGSKDVMISPGIYTYTIEYSTNRQLGFFKDHDELYWNVTGNGWRLPIDQVIAIVHLPTAIPRDQIKLEAYTGSQGRQAQDFRASVDANGAALFETTRVLRIYQGLTIVVTWPKGYIMPPSWWQEWWDFFKDNFHIFIAILGLLCLLGWYLFAWIRVRATQYIDTIIPLFYPPEDMTPGLMRYIIHMEYDSVVLASDIVDMAVHGFLTIEYNPGMVWGGNYVLHKKEMPKTDHYLLLFDTLFGKNNSISLDKKNTQRVDAAINLEKKWYHKICRNYFQSSGWYTFGGVLISLLFSLLLLSLVDDDSRFVLFIAAFVYIWLNIWFFSLLRGYSKKGLLIKKEIDGFKMFLATTEEERLKIIGTPPTRTPELYEKYLPYAIALGVEKQWATKFAPVFEEMRKAGHPYVSIWYVGGDFRSFNSSSFASNISNSVSSSISSSSSRPGGSSGSGGSGSSGGGGGGGGGGGW